MLSENPGIRVFQKWTCAKCRERITANEPNNFTIMGKCEDCGYVTDMRISGCNYMVIASTAGPEIIDMLINKLKS
jgi:hypothetical protein